MMRILITGICGFVGHTLTEGLLDATSANELTIVGIDNLSRPGSWKNWEALRARGVTFLHGDVRSASDLDALGPVDWVIDAAANPSVLAGVSGNASSRQLVEHNLLGTINLLEFCKNARAGFTLLSTSRVYSIAPLVNVQVRGEGNRFEPDKNQVWPKGMSEAGISEDFSTAPPLSLYGSTKLASEILALEYGAAFGFPVWINRCGVLAGAGQFGRPDQGIFAYWINAWLQGKPLKYIGFGGNGWQVRDCLHPRDLVPVVLRQTQMSNDATPQVSNFAGGVSASMSLAELSCWCTARFGKREVVGEPLEGRRFDIPWLVLDCARAATVWDWAPSSSLESILDEIARHAIEHPHWLQLSSP